MAAGAAAGSEEGREKPAAVRRLGPGAAAGAGGGGAARVVRALRFSAKLGFNLHADFWIAVPFAIDSLKAFTRKNINCSIAESLQRFEPIMAAAREHGVRVRGYISCVLGCPIDGDVAPEQVAAIARELLDSGCYEVSLGDTIGVGTPLEPLRGFGPHPRAAQPAPLQGRRGGVSAPPPGWAQHRLLAEFVEWCCRRELLEQAFPIRAQHSWIHP